MNTPVFWNPEQGSGRALRSPRGWSSEQWPQSSNYDVALAFFSPSGSSEILSLIEKDPTNGHRLLRIFS